MSKPIPAVVSVQLEPITIPKHAKLANYSEKEAELTSSCEPTTTRIASAGRLPAFVLDGLATHVEWSNLSTEALEALCARFRADLFEAAKRTLPAEAGAVE